MNLAAQSVRASEHAFPILRWVLLAWLAVYVPAYAHAYGAWHFLMLCNLGVLLTVAGIVFDRPLLLGSQAVAAPGIFVAWIADAGVRLATGAHLHGGTAYMWDPAVPVLVRVLSLYHLAWPFVLAWALDRRGYDRRGLWLQLGIAAATFAVGVVLASPTENLQYVWHAPGATVAVQSPWTRACVLFASLAAVYVVTHVALTLLFARRAPRAFRLRAPVGSGR
ncbi:putative transmembrane protein [Lysobacter dokdonensis DS-58]|uniref:Putative transmembrane protein n=1 Tax=Lysobacter dokdonensis DS-58 TaxID=1300345 RepID=A0A0A2WG55_9GAMM|nr:hypothetical protein [Lysobacter dokdonensis]KGQ18778.1 putative transmembrane protein [Lysobacter dokdonensis DS-58]